MHVILLARMILNLEILVCSAWERYGSLLLVHLELHVIKDSIKVNRVEFDGYLHGWVLLEVYHGLLILLIYNSSSAFNSSALFLRYLFTVKNQELQKSFDNNHSVIWFSCYWIL